MITSRRKFLGGIAALICAPAIVKVSNLMALSPLPIDLFPNPGPNYFTGTTILTPELIAREAVRILENNLFFLSDEGLYMLKDGVDGCSPIAIRPQFYPLDIPSPGTV